MCGCKQARIIDRLI